MANKSLIQAGAKNVPEATGTPGGTAWSTDAELGGKWIGGDGTEELVPAKRYLLPGYVIDCELEKIGVLRNTVGTAKL